MVSDYDGEGDRQGHRRVKNRNAGNYNEIDEKKRETASSDGAESALMNETLAHRYAKVDLGEAQSTHIARSGTMVRSSSNSAALPRSGHVGSRSPRPSAAPLCSGHRTALYHLGHCATVWRLALLPYVSLPWPRTSLCIADLGLLGSEQRGGVAVHWQAVQHYFFQTCEHLSFAASSFDQAQAVQHCLAREQSVQHC